MLDNWKVVERLYIVSIECDVLSKSHLWYYLWRWVYH